MTDNYFETRFCDFDGAEVPPRRYRTLRWAKARAEKLWLDGCGSIWYQGDPGGRPLEMVRYREDGSTIDVTNGDGTTYDDDTDYPLDGLPSFIEPGELAFSLWLHEADGKLALYEFWFDWDGTHHALFTCSGGVSGELAWAGDEGENGADQDSVNGDQGNDLKISDVEGGTRYKVGAFDAIYRDSWVGFARDLFRFSAGGGN
jgi:hypothetical protein